MSKTEMLRQSAAAANAKQLELLAEKVEQVRQAEFLSVEEYQHVQRWADLILKRPAVKRGRMVNRTSGDPSEQLHERHDASDFDTKTQDKIKAGPL